MARHNCQLWTRLGIDCPGGLRLEKSKKRDKEKEPAEVPADPTEDEFEMDQFLFGDKLKRQHDRTNVQSTDASMASQLAMLLELYRRGLTDAVGRDRPKVTVPDPRIIDFPELARRAAEKGASGLPLSLWIAAAAASGAVALRYGNVVANQIPRILPPPGRIAPGGAGAPAGGLHFQAPLFRGIKKRIDRFERIARSGSGDFFPGILG